jgi:hypothetical protein
MSSGAGKALRHDNADIINDLLSLQLLTSCPSHWLAAQFFVYYSTFFCIA